MDGLCQKDRCPNMLQSEQLTTSFSELHSLACEIFVLASRADVFPIDWLDLGLFKDSSVPKCRDFHSAKVIELNALVFLCVKGMLFKTSVKGMFC